MNGYQVNDDWVKHFQQQRRQQAQHFAQLAQASSDRLHAAEAWVRKALPDLADEHGVDPFAVLGAMRLKADHPRQPVTARALRTWLVKHAKEHHRRGYLTDVELAGRLAEVGA